MRTIFYTGVPAWSESEISILRQNINSLSYRALGALLPGRTIDAIKRRATLLGLPRNAKRGQYIKRSLNEEFFSEPNPLCSYWAGFIAADGCVVTHPRKELRIGLHERDVAQLQRFKNDVGYDGPIGKWSKGIRHVTICAAVAFISDLSRHYNVGSRKTFTLEPPNVSGVNALAYSIGLIDGDGCWATSLTKWGKRHKMLVLVGTRSVLLWCLDLWKSSGASVGKVEPRPNRGCWRVSINTSHAESVARLLCPIEVPKLERKWRIARGEATHQPEERRTQEH